MSENKNRITLNLENFNPENIFILDAEQKQSQVDPSIKWISAEMKYDNHPGEIMSLTNADGEEIQVPAKLIDCIIVVDELEGIIYRNENKDKDGKPTGSVNYSLCVNLDENPGSKTYRFMEILEAISERMRHRLINKSWPTYNGKPRGSEQRRSEVEAKSKGLVSFPKKPDGTRKLGAKPRFFGKFRGTVLKDAFGIVKAEDFSGQKVQLKKVAIHFASLYDNKQQTSMQVYIKSALIVGCSPGTDTADIDAEREELLRDKAFIEEYRKAKERLAQEKAEQNSLKKLSSSTSMKEETPDSHQNHEIDQMVNQASTSTTKESKTSTSTTADVLAKLSERRSRRNEDDEEKSKKKSKREVDDSE